MYLFIINRNSGNGHGAHVWLTIQQLLNKRNTPYIHHFTSSAEEGYQLLKQYLESDQTWDAVGVVGGDGTIHSLLPLLQGSKVPLAVIPAGSGNDTARGFGIPSKPADALDTMLNGQSRPVDLIAVNNRIAITALAIGFDAQVAHNVNMSWYKKFCNKLKIGRLSYIIGIIHTLFTYRPGPLTVIHDNGQEHYSSAWLAAITNVQSYGGGVEICPQADPADGILDICIVHNCSRLKLALLFPTVLLGLHTRLSFVKMIRSRSIQVSSEASRLALGDGELVGNTPLTATASNATIHVMSPLSKHSSVL